MIVGLVSFVFGVVLGCFEARREGNEKLTRRFVSFPFVRSFVRLSQQDPSARMITTLLDQTFLAKEYAAIQNDPKRDPRQSFRNPASTSTLSSSGAGGGELERLVGVVGPMGSGGLSMPGVEKAMAEMEGLSSKSSRVSSETRLPPPSFLFVLRANEPLTFFLSFVPSLQQQDPTTRPSLSSSSRDYSYSSPTLPSPLTSPSLSGSAAFPSSAAPSGSAAAGVAPGGAGQPPPSTEALVRRSSPFGARVQELGRPNADLVSLCFFFSFASLTTYYSTTSSNRY